MDNQIVIAGPTSQRLGLKVANLLHTRVVTTENKVFPDGEGYLRIDIEEEAEFEGKDIIIIQSLGANSTGDQNLHIMELIMMIGAAKRMKASKIRVVVPYFAYSRQDKAFRPGECIFAEEILKWIEIAGATEFYTIDVHAEKIFEILKIPAYNLDPMEILAKELAKKCEDPIVICPDKGAYERSRKFAGYLGKNVQVIQFIKKRDVKTGKITMEGDLPIQGKDVIIADDIIASGGTMAKAINIVKIAGAKSIYSVVTHPLMLKNAVFNLMKAGVTDIIGTDTIDSAFMQVSIAEVISKAIHSKSP
nr:ribose-phosphate diphosphokinase [Candidatus Prometheoarchaeum syntrophicum]QEE15988.1 Ribose-phosphate pyrophosphokinase [Candidatus Prometheoarchaeum syntrophicum]